MKTNLFLSALSVAIVAPAVMADTVTVGSASALISAWDAAQDGDVIQLSSDITFDSMWAPADKAVTIDGQNHMIDWSYGATAALPTTATLKNVTILALPGTISAAAGFTIAEGVVFDNSNSTVLTVDDASPVSVGEGVLFNQNNSDDGPAAIAVEDGKRVVIGAGASFLQNQSDEWLGGAIGLYDNAAPMAEGGYNLVINATTGKDTEFAENMHGGRANANDIYFGVNTKALAHAAGTGKITLDSGITSEDESAVLVKDGSGTLEIADGTEFYGSMAVEEGTVSLTGDWGNDVTNGGIYVADGATLAMRGDGLMVNSNIILADGATVDVAENAALGVAVGSSMAVTGTATVKVADSAALSSDSVNISAQADKDVKLTDATISAGLISGTTPTAAVQDAVLQTTADTGLENITLVATQVNQLTSSNLTLTNTTLGSGSAISGGNVVGDIVAYYDDDKIFNVTGTTATYSGATLDTVVLRSGGNGVSLDFSYDVLLKLQAMGVDSVTVTLFNDVTLAQNTTLSLGDNLTWLLKQGLVAGFSANGATGAMPTVLAAGDYSSVSVELSNLKNVTVPEPATATLSLLALAALAARRRRK